MFKKYHKIDSIFKRDDRGKFIIGEYASEELRHLSDISWEFTEKIDGTNIRILWDGETVKFGGRTEDAKIPVSLYDRLLQIFTPEKMKTWFDSDNFFKENPVILFGEGFGNKIQKAGKFYLNDSVDFILFDVFIGMWLRRDSVNNIASRFDIKSAPCLGYGTISDAIFLVKNGFKSQVADCAAEGLVIRPIVELLDRRGRRIITKIKNKDFNN